MEHQSVFDQMEEDVLLLSHSDTYENYLRRKNCTILSQKICGVLPGLLFSPLVKEAVNQIHCNKRRPVSLKNIAEVLHVNASHLSKVFHQETGKTVSDYILMVKMDWAKYLIDSEIYSLSEISQQLGYSSYSYFSQRFKKYFGISPEKYINFTINQST